MARPVFDFGTHVMSHFASYLRLGFLLCSFIFLKNQPLLFFSLVLFASFTGVVDKWFNSCGPPQKRIETTLLNECIDKITLYQLLFALIWVSRVGSEEAQAAKMAFNWSLVFMLDFTAAWFNYYSRFLAGDRTKKVQDQFEAVFLKPLGNVFFDRVLCVGFELWLASEFCKFSSEPVFNRQVQKEWFPLASLVLKLVGSYKIVVNAILLKQGFKRIIDLDC